MTTIHSPTRRQTSSSSDYSSIPPVSRGFDDQMQNLSNLFLAGESDQIKALVLSLYERNDELETENEKLRREKIELDKLLHAATGAATPQDSVPHLSGIQYGDVAAFAGSSRLPLPKEGFGNRTGVPSRPAHFTNQSRDDGHESAALPAEADLPMFPPSNQAITSATPSSPRTYIPVNTDPSNLTHYSSLISKAWPGSMGTFLPWARIRLVEAVRDFLIRNIGPEKAQQCEISVTRGRNTSIVPHVPSERGHREEVRENLRRRRAGEAANLVSSITDSGEDKMEIDEDKSQPYPSHPRMSRTATATHIDFAPSSAIPSTSSQPPKRSHKKRPRPKAATTTEEDERTTTSAGRSFGLMPGPRRKSRKVVESESEREEEWDEEEGDDGMDLTPGNVDASYSRRWGREDERMTPVPLADGIGESAALRHAYMTEMIPVSVGVDGNGLKTPRIQLVVRGRALECIARRGRGFGRRE
ncbi:hypothetical protein HK097_008171 [Rhizophlyctis rosea]|uniref:Uncharacterized protein n=1 Tax=Rhizophlyctis rosea TaxID=64517 RepID=A0AAD5X175_9FUNG|nr:hypothetical protein HK097_008171 [Rhizophlyctis rosea]